MRGRWLWVRVLGGLFVLALLLLTGFVLLVRRNVRRPSLVRVSVTPTEVAAANDSLRHLGFTVGDSGVYTEHPFEAPWTSRSLMVPPTWSAGPGPAIAALLGRREVRASDLRADLDVLEPVMERAYGGWDQAVRRGWNWTDWFADWRARLAARDTAEVSLDEAFAPIDSLLAFQRDNHTQIPIARFTMRASQTLLLASAPSGTCTEVRTSSGVFSIDTTDAAQRVHRALRWAGGRKGFDSASYLVIPASRVNPQHVRCGADWVSLVPMGTSAPSSQAGMLFMLAKAEMFGGHPQVERLAEGVVYARVPSMNPAAYREFDPAAGPTRRSTDRVLVVDLRGNEGGDAPLGMRVLRGWVDPHRLMAVYPSLGFEANTSCLYPTLKYGFVQRFLGIGGVVPLSPEQKNDIQGLVDRIRSPSEPGCPRRVSVQLSKWSYAQHHFAPNADDLRIVALVNAGCGSDCELLTEYLASLPETIVVGINTFGLGQFTQPGYSVLPHTGLSYRIALGMSNPYGDNRSFDGYGLDVDVIVPEVDALGHEQIVALARAVLAGPPSIPQ